MRYDQARQEPSRLTSTKFTPTFNAPGIYILANTSDWKVPAEIEEAQEYP